mmetsp:Transcript_23902/g.65635  ORF Transcript_23902/g.65635 Transcript_23902/m.65635 type:complete len:230 (+) Transcript_23902:846-1535(+)
MSPSPHAQPPPPPPLLLHLPPSSNNNSKSHVQPRLLPPCLGPPAAHTLSHTHSCCRPGAASSCPGSRSPSNACPASRPTTAPLLAMLSSSASTLLPHCHTLLHALLTHAHHPGPHVHRSCRTSVVVDPPMPAATGSSLALFSQAASPPLQYAAQRETQEGQCCLQPSPWQILQVKMQQQQAAEQDGSARMGLLTATAVHTEQQQVGQHLQQLHSHSRLQWVQPMRALRF